jgi:hypothetical protein
MTERPESLEYFFRPGLTWSIKNRFPFKPRPLPAGCIFAHVGSSAFLPEGSEPAYLGLMSSRVFTYLLRLTAGWNYEVGVIQRTPVPDVSEPQATLLGSFALECVYLKRGLDSANEVSHAFHLSALLQPEGGMCPVKCVNSLVRLRLLCSL